MLVMNVAAHYALITSHSQARSRIRGLIGSLKARRRQHKRAKRTSSASQFFVQPSDPSADQARGALLIPEHRSYTQLSRWHMALDR
jgi:hypothetical protein